MANHPSYYTHIQDATLLSAHDPTFTAPIAIMLLNYVLLQKSDHPFLWNIRQNYGFLIKSFLVMASSSVAIVLPQTYLISYLAFGVSHLVIR